MGANSRIGVEQLTLFKILSDIAGGSTTYDVPVGLAKKLIKVGIKNATSLDKQYADDQVVDVYEDDGDAELSVDLTDLTEDEKALMFGQTMSAGIRTPNPATDIRPYFGVSFKARKRNGHYKYYKFLRVKFTEPDEELETKKDKVAAQTDSITGTALRRLSDGLRKRVADEDSATWLAATGANWFASGDISPDTTPPTILSSLPADEATGVAVSANYVWTFSEAILASCVNAGNFTVFVDATGAPVAGTLSLSADGTVVTFDPTNNLTGATLHRAVASTGIRDRSGNALAATSVRKFTTA